MGDEPRGRAGHLFDFTADQIAKACRDEQAYHEERVEHWEGVRDESAAKVRATMSAELVEQHVSNGKQYTVVAKHGDPEAMSRLSTAQGKINHHRGEAARFKREASVYGSQTASKPYVLSPDDVHYFRLGDHERED